MPQIQPVTGSFRFYFLSTCDCLQCSDYYTGEASSLLCVSCPRHMYSLHFIPKETSLNYQSDYVTPQFKVLNATYKALHIGPLLPSLPLS